ncbi:MAG: AAA family ATPase [Oscillospiraceae bacterium]|nr:AAA family ATPase [Oscillospiraceae bacterium]
MNIYIFRGKSATGKTTLTNMLSRKINVPVLRKDDIFDQLSKHETDIAILNSASYDILAKQMQTCIDNQSDIIVDIALQHTPSLNEFLNMIDFKDSMIYRFFCDCSNDTIWLDRWRARLKNPLPNQYFKSIDEIVEHYGKCEIAPLAGEVILDSVNSVNYLLYKIMEII